MTQAPNRPTLIPVSVTVNGLPYEAAVPGRMLLADFLRVELGLTGTHIGCGLGTFGSGMYMFDG